MRTHATILVCCCGALAASLLPAAAVSELDALKASYAAERARVDGVCEQQKTNAFTAYRQSIDAQMLAIKRKGDLDNYLVLEAEKKRFAAEGTVKTNELPAALAGLVAQHQKALQEAAAARDKAKTGLLKQYVSRLTALMQSYTRADRLAEAKAIRDELQVARTDLVFQEEDAPPEPPKTNAPTAKPPAEDDPAKAVVGTWISTWRNMGRSGTDTIVLAADGTASCINDHSTGRWEMKDRQCIIHWARTDSTFTLATDGKHMTGHNRQGTSLTAVKSGP